MSYKIAYVSQVRFPTEKAHGKQIAEVCSALGSLGHAVTLLHPNVYTPITQSPYDYYDVHNNFTVQKLHSFDALICRWIPEFLSFAITMWSYRSKVHHFLLQNQFDVLYTRSVAILAPLFATGKPVLLELHSLPRCTKKFINNCNRCTRVICLTSPMRDELVALGVESSRVVVAGDAVDLRRFSSLPSKKEAQEFFGFKTDKSIVGYVGRLKTMEWEKGVRYLLEATALLKKRGTSIMCLIVGGPEEDKKEYEALATSLGLVNDDILFTGSIPAADVPKALIACDVLAMPFPDLPHYRTNMSPLKMFEYMAAGKPIVTSDLPTIRDVLSEETAFFCTPNDSNSLASTIAHILSHLDDAQKRAAVAHKLVQEHTWEKRMSRVLDAISA